MFGNILVIDRDAEWREFFYGILTQANYSVTTFPSERGIAELLKNNRPDCVICDLSAGDPAGLFEKIMGIDRNIAIIAVSSDISAFKESEKRFSRDRRIYFLAKDGDKTQLIQEVFDILKQGRPAGAAEGKTAFTGRIMIVDDEEEANNLIRNYLERRGYNVASAFNGEEALLKMKLYNPAVVILDICMRGIDGMLILKHIKESNPQAVVIMTSGIAEDAMIEEARALGANDYLVKPFNLSRLEAAILTHSLLSRSNNGVG